MAGSSKAAMEGSSTDAMEGIRRAAGAYYDHLPDGKKKKATEAFNDMDKNKDGKISLLEYVNYLKKKKAKDLVHPSIFTALDKDDNGSLDFDEAIVLFYLMKSGRALICKGCEKFLAGAYFSCSQCFFNVSVSTYEICCACYRGNKFTHHGDAIFCDNYTLLSQSRSLAVKAPVQNRRNVLEKIVMIVEVTSVAVALGCSIM